MPGRPRLPRSDCVDAVAPTPATAWTSLVVGADVKGTGVPTGLRTPPCAACEQTTGLAPLWNPSTDFRATAALVDDGLPVGRSPRLAWLDPARGGRSWKPPFGRATHSFDSRTLHLQCRLGLVHRHPVVSMAAVRSEDQAGKSLNM